MLHFPFVRSLMEKNIVNKEHSSPLSCTNGDPADDGRVVSASDTKSGSPRFESRSDHFVVFVLSRPEFKPSTMPAGKNQLIAFCQLFFFYPVMFYLDYLCLIIWVECLV